MQFCLIVYVHNYMYFKKRVTLCFWGARWSFKGDILAYVMYELLKVCLYFIIQIPL